MKRIVLATAILASAVGTGIAQQMPADPPPVMIEGHLAQALISHLMNGGTISAGQEMARQIYDAAQAPQKEAEMRKRIQEELRTAGGNTPPK